MLEKGVPGQYKMAIMFKFIFLYVEIQIVIKISLKFVPKGPVDNTAALVQTYSAPIHCLNKWWAMHHSTL